MFASSYLRFLVNALNGQMSITRVEEQDHGGYTCKAQNAAGLSESSTFLSVLVRPKIYEFFNITVPVDTETIFNCRATGRPAPQITFR
jgi:neural cell adhesion molecule